MPTGNTAEQGYQHAMYSIVPYVFENATNVFQALNIATRQYELPVFFSIKCRVKQVDTTGGAVFSLMNKTLRVLHASFDFCKYVPTLYQNERRQKIDNYCK